MSSRRLAVILPVGGVALTWQILRQIDAQFRHVTVGDCREHFRSEQVLAKLGTVGAETVLELTMATLDGEINADQRVVLIRHGVDAELSKFRETIRGELDANADKK
jgi:hypothetical protein